ncbi:MAG: acetate--CoA ligase family protein [Suipraeoptans sp.]
MSRVLNELDARNLLLDYGIPMVRSSVVKSESEISEYSKDMKFPIVMKILSADILHKTEAKCVFVGVSKDEVLSIYQKILVNARAYNENAKIDGVLMQEMASSGLEVIMGMKKDPQFGPVIMVGMGGIYVEVFKDVALRLLPLDRDEIVNMINETKLNRIIKGARGTKYDIDTLTDSLEKMTRLVEENPSIEEIDVNPLFLYEEGHGAKGVDALIKISD